MQKLGLNEIRERYLSFFESKQHLRLSSFPLVPQNDASLLLINAGMAPLKPYFTGKEIPPRNRITTCQKCIRTPDIERVGITARHGTYFEMLGNFSFGDYFKHEATAWAWEFVTQTMEMPVDKLWVSIYEDDDEAYDIWTKEVGVSPDRMVRLGKADNFWEIGTGPCGPCSEIYFDRGAENGCGSADCAVGCDCDRFVEFWNLVFTQFDKDENGVYNRLAKPNIDTGMGLERIAAIMQGVNSLFEVDTIKNIMLKVSEVSGVQYGSGKNTDISLRVVTDHVRSTTFMICDGVLPSNEGRGYVLRRLLRRAARHGKLLGIQKPFIFELANTVINESKEAYPELSSKADYIKSVIKIEEERFDETIDQGLNILNEYIAKLKTDGKTTLSGELTFKLYDTFGFPIDLTIEILAEQGMQVDRDGFDKEMAAQRERARSARQDAGGAGWDDNIYSTMKELKTEFVGYDNNECEAKILAIVKDNEAVSNIMAGDRAILILDKTVLYGESGGQVGDTGVIKNQNSTAEVTDCKKLGDGKILHHVTLNSGALAVNDSVVAAYDEKRRSSIKRNHSATHLLQKALKDVLGNHIEQAGSMVSADRLRFDFSHFKAVTKEELSQIEAAVNNAILAALPIDINQMPIDEARRLGAMALFGEKYGEVVRVVKMGDYSIELCGGSHLTNTSQAGLFKLLSESGVAAGVRRIEAITGLSVMDYLYELQSTLDSAAAALKVNASELTRKAEGILTENKLLQKELESIRSKQASGEVDTLIENAADINGVKLITAKFSGMDAEGLRTMCDAIKEKNISAVAVLAGMADEKLVFVAMATKSAVQKGAHAGNIIREVAKAAGGGGGGKPDMAQAGGKDISKTDDALKAAEAVLKGQIK